MPSSVELDRRRSMTMHEPSDGAAGRRPRRHADGRHRRARADRVADALVPRLAPPLHRPRVQAVRERRADDRPARRQPALRRRARDVAVDVSGERVVAVKARRGRLQRVPARLEGHRPRRDQADRAGAARSSATRTAGTSRGWSRSRSRRRTAKGRARPISLPSIEIADGTRHDRRSVGAGGYRLPRRIDGARPQGVVRVRAGALHRRSSTTSASAPRRPS